MSELKAPDYESLSHLKEAAAKMRERQIKSAKSADDPFAVGDDGLTISEATQLLNETLRPGRLRNDLTKKESQPWDEMTENRETSDYWHAHCMIVGESMLNLAEKLGESNPSLWYITGLLHDLDFLDYPHFSEETDKSKAHPMEMVIRLEGQIPPAAILAIMEHSPHLNYPSTSPLSHGLILADEHATMTGREIDPKYPLESSELTSVLKDGTSITGWVRQDMQERANQALVALMRYFKGEEPQKKQFNANGW